MTIDDVLILIVLNLSLLGVGAISWGVPALWRRQVRAVLAAKKAETSEWIDKYTPMLFQLGMALRGSIASNAPPCGCSERAGGAPDVSPEPRRESEAELLRALASLLQSRLAPGERLTPLEYEALSVIADALVVPVDGGELPSREGLQRLLGLLTVEPRPTAGQSIVDHSAFAEGVASANRQHAKDVEVVNAARAELDKLVPALRQALAERNRENEALRSRWRVSDVRRDEALRSLELFARTAYATVAQLRGAGPRRADAFIEFAAEVARAAALDIGVIGESRAVPAWRAARAAYDRRIAALGGNEAPAAAAPGDRGAGAEAAEVPSAVLEQLGELGPRPAGDAPDRAQEAGQLGAAGGEG